MSLYDRVVLDEARGPTPKHKAVYAAIRKAAPDVAAKADAKGVLASSVSPTGMQTAMEIAKAAGASVATVRKMLKAWLADGLVIEGETERKKKRGWKHGGEFDYAYYAGYLRTKDDL